MQRDTLELWKEFETLKDSMEDLHDQWREALLFLDGFQTWLLTSGGLVDLADDAASSEQRARDRAEVIHNFLQGMFQRKMAAALQNEPQPVVSLLQDSEEARATERVCTALLTNHYYEKGLKSAYRDAVAWAFTVNIGYIGVLWDLFAVPPIEQEMTDEQGNPVLKLGKREMVDEAGQPLRGIDGMPMFEEVEEPETEIIYPGDVKYSGLSPFDVFPEPARTWTDVRRVFFRQFFPLEQLKETVKGVPDDITPDADISDFDTWGAHITNTNVWQEQKYVTVVSLFEMPTRKYLKGRHVMFTRDHVLVEQDLPGGVLPISPIFDIYHPSQLYHRSPLSTALAPQRALNAVEADIRTNTRFHSNPKVLVEEGSLIDRTGEGRLEIPNEPDAVIEYKKGSRPPEHMETADIPQWVQQLPGHYFEVIQSLMGVHSFSMGASRGANSGAQVRAHEAADQSKWMPTIVSMAEGLEHCCKVGLELERLYGEDGRLFQAYGPNGSPRDIQTFRGSTLTGNFKVRVDASAMRPYNPELKEQKILERWTQGLYPDQYSVWVDLKSAQMTDYLGRDEPSRKRCYEEHALMDQGMQVPVEFWEDHMVHQDCHLARMRAPEFYALPDAARAAYVEHMQATAQALQPTNLPNPVATGASPMPPPEVGPGATADTQSPVLNGAVSQGTMPGRNLRQETGYQER